MLHTKSKNPHKKPVFNPLEQIRELGVDTIKKAGEEAINIINPFPEIWGSPTPKPEHQPGGPNFSPVDFKKLEGQYQNQDNPDIEKIRQQLQGAPQMTDEQEHMKRHKEYKQEEEEFHTQLEQEEAEKEREEAMEEQQKREEEAAEKSAHSQALPQGKVRKNILGGGHKKANMDLPPEVRAERKGGAGKY